MTEITIEQMKKAIACFEEMSDEQFYPAGTQMWYEQTEEGIECYKVGAKILRQRIAEETEK